MVITPPADTTVDISISTPTIAATTGGTTTTKIDEGMRWARSTPNHDTQVSSVPPLAISGAITLETWRRNADVELTSVPSAPDALVNKVNGSH